MFTRSLEKSHRDERVIDEKPDENDEDMKTSKDPSGKNNTPVEDDSDLESAPKAESAAKA